MDVPLPKVCHIFSCSIVSLHLVIITWRTIVSHLALHYFPRHCRWVVWLGLVFPHHRANVTTRASSKKLTVACTKLTFSFNRFPLQLRKLNTGCWATGPLDLLCCAP